MHSLRCIITSSIKVLALVHSLNGTVHLSDVKICNRPILPTLFFSACFKTGFRIRPCIELKKTNGHVIHSAVGRP